MFSKCFQNFKCFFNNLSIKGKIIFIFTSFIGLYAIITSIIYAQVFHRENFKQLRQSSYQSIDIMQSNIASNIEAINNVSKMLIVDSNVHNYLIHSHNNMQYQRATLETLKNLYVSFPFIDSVYVYHLDGSNVNSTRTMTLSLIDNLQDTSWYTTVMALKGTPYITINADNTLLPRKGENNISLMRAIYDIDKMMPIGIVIVNSSQNFFSPIIEEVKEKYGTSFILLDGSGSPIIKTDDPITLSQDYSTYLDGAIDTINGQKSFIVCSTIPEYNWKIISYTPLHNLRLSLNTFMVTLIILVFFTIFIFVAASIFTANTVTFPIKKLITSMKGVKEGYFKHADMLVGTDEIGELKNTYNLMIDEIEKMIKNEVETEKQKRMFELDILNEQIKPHFLYNTLDTISYLVLSQNNDQAYTAITALGQFYRSSLNKGKETLSLREELNMIKNYLTLQKLRYGHIIKDSYFLSEDSLDLPILKNSLQPIIENCIYHGIKPSGELGNIIVKSHIASQKLVITIEDDGLGIPPDELKHLQEDSLYKNTSSFGLRGTISRLKLYYEIEDVYEISSKVFEGTCVTLKIPIKKENV